MSEKLTSLEQILSAAKEEQHKYASTFWAPSTQKGVRLTEITTAQQKRLIKSVIDSPIFNTEFIFTFRDILKENCVDNIDIDTLTLIDKLAIAIGLRVACIGATVDLEVTTEDDKDPVTYTLDLMELHETIKKSVKNIKPKIFQQNIFEVTCSVPTIGVEFRVEKELRGNGEELNLETNEQLRDVLGEAFITEIVKYIQQVKIKQGDAFVEIDWTSMSFADRIKVTETFGMNLLKQIIDYINLIKTEIDKIEVIKFKIGDKDYERRLTIDGNFFTIS